MTDDFHNVNNDILNIISVTQPQGKYFLLFIYVYCLIFELRNQINIARSGMFREVRRCHKFSRQYF